MSNTALGAALTIDDSVLAKIQEIDKNLEKLQDTARITAVKISGQFKGAADVGLQYFIDKLKIAQTELSKVSSLSLGGNANVFTNLGQQATAAASNITQMAVAMNQYVSSIDKAKIANAQSQLDERISLNEIKAAMNEQLEIMRKLNQANRENALEAKKAANETKVQSAQATRDTQARVSAIRNETQQIKAGEAAYRNYSRAMLMSEQTITSRTKKIERLKAVTAELSKNESKYTNELNLARQKMQSLVSENKKYESSVKNINTSHKNLMNTSDQLMRKLALIFSVSQIQGYVNKLIQVRGEFELQNTALASILQNKDQADKLFGQITELAVKSPFTVKELTTYTKSLAAYQFQYEELYDTTKRLADVASGLGVDMQRLILAVGQVKAAGYLRGTETRQFTEAGFNILGELAKYYSELENRIVSVGEVQERQFKRMIAFQDVEAVFKRVTDAGGMFYQMQEKQAETLAGQMSNLKDSIDLMFNSIGKANDGTLKDMVALVRSFIENWQEVVFVLKPAVAALGAWKALTLLASIGNKKFALSLYAIATNAKTATASISLMKRATTMLAAVGRGLMSVFAIAIPVALIAGVMELYRVTTKASREANELKKALDGISNEGFVRASELISNFKVLAEKAVEAADGSKEQQAALEELQRTYKDILPERDLEIDKLRELKGEYDNVTTAIYSKIEAQIKEKQIQEVSNTYGTAASEAMDALAKRLTDYNISLSTAKTITNEFKKMLEQGMIKDANQAKTELENLIRLFSGQYSSLGEKNIWQRLGWTTGVDVIDEIDDAFNAFTRFNDEVKRLEGEPITPFRIGGGTEMYQSLKEELENIAKFKEDWEKQNKDKFKFKVEFNEESKNALIAEYQKFIADLNSKISSGQIKQGDILSAKLIIEEAQKAIEKLDVSPQIAQVNDLRVEFSKLYNIDFEKFNFTKMLEGQGFNDFIKRLDEGIQGYKEIIEVFDEAARRGTEVPAMQQWALLQGKTIEEIRAFVPVLEEYRAKLALVTKEESKSGRDTTSQVFKDRLSFFERANKEYEKLLQNYSAEEARAKVLKTMMAEAEERKVGGIFMSAEFDDQGTLDSFNKVRAMYKKLPEDLQAEFLKRFGAIEIGMDIEVRQDRVKAIQDQFSNLFGNYELSLELDKLGLDKDLMSQLFGVEVFDLSQLRKVLEPFKNELQNTLGKEGVSAWDEMNKKISEAEEKELQDRLKTYAKYLKKSISARAQAEIESQKEIAKIQKTEGLSYETKNALIKQKREETVKIKAKLEWEDFKSSDVYVKLFDDLEYVSNAALNRLKQNLDMVKESMGELEPEQLKAIQEAYNKIEEQVITRNPFSAMRDAMKEVNELQKQGLTEDVLQQNLLMYDAQAKSLKTQITDIETIIGLKQNGISLDTQEQSFLDRNVQYLDKNVESLRQMVTLKKSALSGVQNNISITNNDLESYEKARMSLAAMSAQVDTIRSLGQNAFGNIKSILESVGVEADSTAMIFADMGMSMVDLIAQAVMFGLQLQTLTIAAEMLGVAMNTALGPIGWAVMALQAITMGITAIFQVHDNKRQEIIDREQDKIDELQRSYDELTRTIEKGVSLLEYTENADLTQNLQDQIKSYKAMIAAEEDKKKSDEDQIKQWEDDIIDLTNQISDTYDSLRENLVGNFKSLSEELGDAIVSAFDEGGDAAAKWGETVNDIIGDILKNILIQKYLEPQIQSVLDEYFDEIMPKTSVAEKAYSKVEELQKEYDEINNRQVSGFKDYAQKWQDLQKAESELNAAIAEWEKLNAAAAGEIPQITEEATNKLDEDITGIGEGFQGILEGLPESLKKYFEGESTDTMTGLSKSISGITADQADALAAITESIRFFTADSNAKLTSILAALTAPTPENPFLLELKSQTEQLRTMNSLWNSLSKTSTGNGKVLKVQIV